MKTDEEEEQENVLKEIIVKLLESMCFYASSK